MRKEAYIFVCNDHPVMADDRQRPVAMAVLLVAFVAYISTFELMKTRLFCHRGYNETTSLMRKVVKMTSRVDIA